jgi:membrane-bound serine protease (ClpP class)
MAELLTKISDAEIPVAVWVGPTGARAYGLSAQLLAVADVRAMAPGARIGFTGQALKVNGTEISFGTIGAVLRTSTIGFTEARKEGVLNYAGDDEGVPVVRNMLLALDGIKVGNTELNTVIEKVDSSGQIVRDATAARFFKLELTGQLMHTVASPPVAYLLFAIGLALLVFEFFTAGIGIRYQTFGLDFAYLLPVQSNHPLAETLRFSLLFDMNLAKSEESITEKASGPGAQ